MAYYDRLEHYGEKYESFKISRHLVEPSVGVSRGGWREKTANCPWASWMHSEQSILVSSSSQVIEVNLC